MSDTLPRQLQPSMRLWLCSAFRGHCYCQAMRFVQHACHACMHACACNVHAGAALTWSCRLLGRPRPARTRQRFPGYASECCYDSMPDACTASTHASVQQIVTCCNPLPKPAHGAAIVGHRTPGAPTSPSSRAANRLQRKLHACAFSRVLFCHACRVYNFASDDPDDLDLQPEVNHSQASRRADEEAALSKVKAQLRPKLLGALDQLLEELKQK